ncbi:PREDICTED: target of EGR1 protein 1-like isoform X2 [Priapulus caudatus]|uniref:Target of EGR1 protein 1-like isoform X2 n=1 Tax=Priapulus caudatus TaxID=37621 RepID=A0ABM1E933_PRICU|nr:PREDICTED: target of EGR1 protein 1-like isoform X2 [Priapulus caudatus]
MANGHNPQLTLTGSCTGAKVVAEYGEMQGEDTVMEDAMQYGSTIGGGARKGGSAESESASSRPERELCTEYTVQTFSITVLCSESYVVEPAALQFLVSHGFDFNKQYTTGVPYYRGNDKRDDDDEACLLRRVVTELVACRRVVALHNGFIDLVFTYANLYARAARPTLATFPRRPSRRCSPARRVRHEHIAEFGARLPASYLEYVYRKCQRDNFAEAQGSKRHIGIHFLDYRDCAGFVDYRPCGLDMGDHTGSPFCKRYGAHGWCPAGTSCELSHDIDVILDNDGCTIERKKRRRTRKRTHQRQLKHGEAAAVVVDASSRDAEVVDASSRDAEVVDALCYGEPMGETAGQSVGQLADTNSGPASMDRSSVIDEAARGERNGSTGTEESLLEAGDAASVSRAVKDYSVKHTGGHRAGYDAFMTGFAMAYYIRKHGDLKSPGFGLGRFENRLCLSGKDVGLLISKSTFVKNSKYHTEKLERIENAQLNITH